jgi:hypothetical protein
LSFVTNVSWTCQKWLMKFSRKCRLWLNFNRKDHFKIHVFILVFSCEWEASLDKILTYLSYLWYCNVNQLQYWHWPHVYSSIYKRCMQVDSHCTIEGQGTQKAYHPHCKANNLLCGTQEQCLLQHAQWLSSINKNLILMFLKQVGFST